MTGTDLFAAEIGDPEATRTVIAIVALLCVMGIALIMLALWLRRVTRPDPELLAPLEMMGERSWRRADPVGQRRRLDDVRPDGAEPLTRAAAPPKLDAAFDEGPSAPGFDDLRANEPDPTDLSAGTVEAEPLVPTPPEGTLLPDGAPVGTVDDATEVAAVDEVEPSEPSDDVTEVAAADQVGTVDDVTEAAAVDQVDTVDDATEVDEPVDVADAAVAEEVGLAVDVAETDEGPVDATFDEPVDASSEDEQGGPDSPTPMATNRPALEDLFADLTDGDIDPEALARAKAELDAELRQGVQDT